MRVVLAGIDGLRQLQRGGDQRIGESLLPGGETRQRHVRVIAVAASGFDERARDPLAIEPEYGRVPVKIDHAADYAETDRGNEKDPAARDLILADHDGSADEGS